MELLLRYCYDVLHIISHEHPLLIAEKDSTRSIREKMTEMALETFEVPQFYTALQSVLAVYASGNTTGVAVDIGHDMILISVVYEGYSNPSASVKLHYGSANITRNIATKLGIPDLEIARNIKEKYCNLLEDKIQGEQKKYFTSCPQGI